MLFYTNFNKDLSKGCLYIVIYILTLIKVRSSYSKFPVFYHIYLFKNVMILKTNIIVVKKNVN
jgi:hypothetical protein